MENQLCALLQQPGHVVVDDVGEFAYNFRALGNQRGQRVHDALHQVAQQIKAGFDQLGCCIVQGLCEIHNDIQTLGHQAGQRRADTLAQLAQQFAALAQHGRQVGLEALDKAAYGVHCTLGHGGQVAGHARQELVQHFAAGGQ